LRPDYGMPYTNLVLESDDPVARITLKRPERRNALSPEMIVEFLRTLDEVERGGARVLILTGAGKAFCAGVDLGYLKDFPAQSLEDIRLDARRIATLFRRLWTFPKPVIAAVNGPALAGGCALATFCDFTLAVPEATFGYTEVRVGFIPAIVSCFVMRQLGEKRARELLLSGRIIDSREAASLGLVTEIVPAAQLLTRAGELAASLAQMSPTALSSAKRLLIDFSNAELDRELEMAIESSVRIRATHDFREGLAAFLEKRKPVWQAQ